MFPRFSRNSKNNMKSPAQQQHSKQSRKHTITSLLTFMEASIFVKFQYFQLFIFFTVVIILLTFTPVSESFLSNHLQISLQKVTQFPSTHQNMKFQSKRPSENCDNIYDIPRSGYRNFWDHCLEELQLLGPLTEYPLPQGIQTKYGIVGKKKEAACLSFCGYQSSKIRQVRACFFEGNGSTEVLNLVIFPSFELDIPIFGVDLVALPGKKLNVIDLQPVFQDPAYDAKYYTESLQDLHKNFSKHLPKEMELPTEAQKYFSPYAIWSKTPRDDDRTDNLVSECFAEYLKYYCKLLEKAEPVQDKSTCLQIKERHLEYSKYRYEKDPARGLLTRFFGAEWSDIVLSSFLFDLVQKESQL